MSSSHNFRRLPCPKLALSIVVFSACFWPGDATAQITLVNVTSCGPGSFPMTCTVPSTGSGNLLVVGWTGGAGLSLLKSISDNTGNSYTEVTGSRAANGSAAVSEELWYAANSKPGTTSLTLTSKPRGAQGAAVIWEFSGASTTSPLAQTAALSGQPASTTPTGASVTTTTADELIVSIAAASNSISGITQGSAFTEDSSVRSNGWAHLATVFPGTYSAEWNESPSGRYCTGTAAFTTGLTYLLTDSPTSLSFGDVLIGSCSTLISTLASTGTGPVTINPINVAGAGFTAGGPVLPFTLAAGYNTPLNVTFCPTSGASIVGSVTVVSNASNSPAVVPVSGTGLHNVALSWSPSTSAIGYDVYRSTTSGSFGSTPINSSLVACCAYTDSSVTAGTTYYYVTTAVNASGVQSTFSNQVTAPISSP
jgi:hypothetical protein